MQLIKEVNRTRTSQVGAISKPQIKSKGGPFVDKKNQEKVAQCRKTERGDPLHSSGFVGYV